jgi:hypothetical protein
VILVIWLLTLTVAVVLADGWLDRSGTSAKLAECSYRRMATLHGIQRQKEVAQFKAQLRRDAVILRRRLDAELRELDRREGGRR